MPKRGQIERGKRAIRQAQAIRQLDAILRVVPDAAILEQAQAIADSLPHRPKPVPSYRYPKRRTGYD